MSSLSRPETLETKHEGTSVGLLGDVEVGEILIFNLLEVAGIVAGRDRQASKQAGNGDDNHFSENPIVDFNSNRFWRFSLNLAVCF